MIKVTNDLFGIAKRLQQINPKYRVYYNKLLERFEVHTNGLEFVVPYPILDCRTLDYALRTRIQNDYEIENEIDENNARIENSARKTMDKLGGRLRDMLEFANRTGHGVAFTKEYKKEF